MQLYQLPSQKKYTYVLFILWMAGIYQPHLLAQELVFQNQVPASISVCHNTETFSVYLTNETGSPTGNLFIDIHFPDGIQYVPGSLTNMIGATVVESNSNDLSHISFIASSIQDGQFLSFELQGEATFEAYQAYQNNTLFINTIDVAYQGGNTSVETSPYELFFPVLEIENVNTSNLLISEGQSFTNAITVINNGTGQLDAFTLLHEHGSTITWLTADKGTLNATGDALTLSAADFEQIGDGDDYFDVGEFILITQTLQGEQCGTETSAIKAVWGCQGATIVSNDVSIETTILNTQPNLASSATASFQVCQNGLGDLQSLAVFNSSPGQALDVQLTIEQAAMNGFTSMDLSSIQYSVNGAPMLPITATTFELAENTCFGVTDVASFVLDIPVIEPFEMIIFQWANNTCLPADCFSEPFSGWSYNLKYTDVCNSNDYCFNGVGEVPQQCTFDILYESPSTIDSDESAAFNFQLSNTVFDMEQGASPYFELVFNIPEGLSWNANPDDLTFENEGVFWMPDQVTFSQSQQTLIGQFPFPIPFSLEAADIQLNLSLDCSNNPINGPASVDFNMYYRMDGNCSNSYRIPVNCQTNANTYIACQTACFEGLIFDDFTLARTTLGQADNDEDGQPDINGVLDTGRIKLNRVMFNDEFSTQFKGRIKTSTTHANWAHAYAVSTVPQGANFELEDVRLFVDNPSSGLQLLSTAVPHEISMNGMAKEFRFDLSPASMLLAGNPQFAGLEYQDGDELLLEVDYKVVGNVGNTTEQITFSNEFYVSESATGPAFQCNSQEGNLSLVGYEFGQGAGQLYTVNTCAKTLEKSFYMGIGGCCENAIGGNLFPFEYRNWGYIEALQVQLPIGYELVLTTLKIYDGLDDNAFSFEEVDIEPVDPSASLLTYDISTYFEQSGGPLSLSDDGFYGDIILVLQPSCQLTAGATLPVDWSFTYRASDDMGGGTLHDLAGDTDELLYTQGQQIMYAAEQTVFGVGETVTWEVNISNNYAAAPYTWLYPYAPDASMEIINIVNLATGDTMTAVNDIYKLGYFSSTQNSHYSITARLLDCSSYAMYLYSGYSCDTYPQSFDQVTCGYEEYPLYVHNKPAALQTKINNSLGSGDPCSNVSIELELASVQLGNVTDIEIVIEVPENQSMELLTGSLQKQFPVNGDFEVIPLPQLTGNQYILKGSDIDPFLESYGLSGQDDLHHNKLNLKFEAVKAPHFHRDDELKITIRGKRNCAEALNTIQYHVDLNTTMSAIESEGIGIGSVGENWGVAWGDYDNDGYPDLFIVNNDKEQPNELFHNEGNGSFTKITSGAIATDIGASVSSSWADYDNDGDVDLYVANTGGYPNFLYRNEGNGQFIRIHNDPIVSEWGFSFGVSWADYDNDGFLDLFLATFGETTFNQLYHNNGDGTFRKVTNNPVVNEAAKSISGTWADYNNDGLQDLYVANFDNTPNSLYKNLGNGNFEKVNNSPVSSDIGYSVGSSWGDYNNDGYLDLFVANASNQYNCLYKNNQDGTFVKITDGRIVNEKGHSHGSGWADYDLDGDLDLFVANDSQNNRLFRNDGNDQFSLIENRMTQDGEVSFASAWADYDQDGDVDLLVANREGNGNFLYANSKGGCSSWTCIELKGRISNASAIGARVYIYATIFGVPVMQSREISSLTGGGTSSQSDFTAKVGLGDATGIDSIVVVWPSGFSQTLNHQVVNQRLTIVETSASEVCGTVFYDENNNCKQDPGEIGIPNAKINLIPGNISAFSDENGRYSLFVEPGAYAIQQTVGTNWNSVCLNSQEILTVHVTDVGSQYCGNDFANEAICDLPDLRANIAIAAHRIGYANLMVIDFENKGAAVSTNTVLSLSLPPEIQLLETSLPFVGEVGNAYSWQLNNLLPGEKGAIYISYEVRNDTEIGTELFLIANISGNEDDCDLANNRFVESSIAIGALDPNDMLVQPEGAVAKDDWLYYKIRFQNLGNSPAGIVRVEDSLPHNLDLATLEMGIASHSYQFEMKGRELIWTFPSINLPDSLSNEPESHGFITFKIKPDPSIAQGEFILNSAAIYFDNNPPIYTNEVENFINDYPVQSLNHHTYSLLVHPNPTVGPVTVQSLDIDQTEQLFFTRVEVMDNLSRPVLQLGGTANLKAQFSTELLPSGTYIIQALDSKGNLHIGRVVKSKI